MQGDLKYLGATPSYVIWNLLQRYTRAGELVLDPMCGSGTTIDVAHDLNRRAIGFDISPYRLDIVKADARHLPLRSTSVDFAFVDPPYSTHIEYSDDPRCIGKLDASTPDYYEAMGEVFREMCRVLKPEKFVGVYCCDSFRKNKPFCPIGVRLFELLENFFEPIDVIAVVRHNRTLKRRHYHTEAVKGNFYLRGFNYLFIFKKTARRMSNHSASPKKTKRHKRTK